MKIYYYQGTELHLDVYELTPLCDVYSDFQQLIDGLKKVYKTGKTICIDKQDKIKEDEFYIDEEREIAYVSIECEGHYQLKIETLSKHL